MYEACRLRSAGLNYYNLLYTVTVLHNSRDVLHMLYDELSVPHIFSVVREWNIIQYLLFFTILQNGGFLCTMTVTDNRIRPSNLLRYWWLCAFCNCYRIEQNLQTKSSRVSITPFVNSTLTRRVRNGTCSLVYEQGGRKRCQCRQCSRPPVNKSKCQVVSSAVAAPSQNVANTPEATTTPQQRSSEEASHSLSPIPLTALQAATTRFVICIPHQK